MLKKQKLGDGIGYFNQFRICSMQKPQRVEVKTNWVIGCQKYGGWPYFGVVCKNLHATMRAAAAKAGSNGIGLIVGSALLSFQRR